MKPLSCAEDPQRCAKCPLYKVRCAGCVESGKDNPSSPYSCLQHSCASACDTCGGAQNARVPTICCKSPDLDETFPDLHTWAKPGTHELSTSAYTPRDALQFPVGQIPVVAGKLPKNAYAPPVVAVALRHVWGVRRGFWSVDLKDYLQLPSTTQLLLLSTMKDDILEAALAKNAYQDAHIHFPTRGIDVWMPLMFSAYHQKGNMSNFYDGLRSMRSLRDSCAHFVPAVWDHGLRTRELYEAAVSRVHNVVINGQFLINKVNQTQKLAQVLRHHNTWPLHVPFLIVGPSTPKSILTFRRYCPGRRIYVASTSPWNLSHHGKVWNGQFQEVQNKTDSIVDLWDHNVRFWERIDQIDHHAMPVSDAAKKYIESIGEVV